MTPPTITRAARARGDEQTSRDVLLAGLSLAAKLAADTDQPPTTRTRALAELRAIAKVLDDIDKANAQAALSWIDSLPAPRAV